MAVIGHQAYMVTAIGSGRRRPARLGVTTHGASILGTDVYSIIKWTTPDTCVASEADRKI